MPKSMYKVGDKIHGYVVQQTEDIKEYYLNATLFRHEKTGARHLHFLSDDSNKTFVMGFRTQSNDNTGKAHILEHSVLAGSKKYKVRDPFFSMLNRSLSNFMNAMTASDWTCYPYSTVNDKDYMNLMSVYLDALFAPKLDIDKFRQEGWRLTHENAESDSSDIIIKGVVYNEMKGVFNNPQNELCDQIERHLLCDTNYKYNSGGIPAEVANLTHEDLLKYYHYNYHPSNSYCYTYGNSDPAPYLKYINETVMSKYEPRTMDNFVVAQKNLATAREIFVNCAASKDKKNDHTFTKTYLLTDTSDLYETFVVEMVCKLLVSGENSPFYKNLIESELGSGYAEATGFSNTVRSTNFTVGLQDIAPENVAKVDAIISETFEKVSKEGFAADRIEGVLNTIILSQKHQSTRKGLNMGLNLLYYWVVDEINIIDVIKMSQYIDYFKKKIAGDENYLKDKVKQYFIDNKHVLSATLKPTESYKDDVVTAEKKLCKSIYDNLSETEKKAIYPDCQRFAKMLATKDNVECLPCLSVDDIDKEFEYVPFETRMIDDVSIHKVLYGTNGIVYFSALICIDDIPYDLKKYLGIFSLIFTRIGTEKSDCRQITQRQEFCSKGFSSFVSITHQPRVSNTYKSLFSIGSYCLENFSTEMFDIWAEIFDSIKFTDKTQLKAILNKSLADYNSSISDSGHSFAMSKAGSNVCGASALSDDLGGLGQYYFLKKIVENFDSDHIFGKLKEINKYLNCKKDWRIRVNYSPTFEDKIDSTLSQFLSKITFVDRVSHPVYCKPKNDAKCHVKCPYQVNYVAQTIPGVPILHPDRPKIEIMCKIFTKNYLHKEIREKGGAYGGNARVTDNKIEFYSYRDPNVINTIKVFEEAADFLLNCDITDNDLLEAKLSVFKNLDAPVSPGDKTSYLFSKNVSYQDMNEYRQNLFNVKINDIYDVCRRYIRDPPARSGFCVIGEEAEFSQKEDWIVEKI
ncbi:Mitochondrial presequence protease [Intoshia linei]|uniref:Presequence protease, mitochondrial n=1 Tax=Intoshia linei TaxID=1819745 RepID=A0A177B5J6_9BILA|nr:Mitochondrial presequence protease [Intoshia linei]